MSRARHPHPVHPEPVEGPARHAGLRQAQPERCRM